MISANQKYGDFDGDGRVDLLFYSPSTEGYYECLEYDDYGYCDRQGEYIEPTVGGTYIAYNKFDGNYTTVKVSDENLSNGIVVSGLLDNNGKVSTGQGLVIKETPSATSPNLKIKTYILNNSVFALAKTITIPSSAYDNTYVSPPNPGHFEPHVESSTSLGSFKDLDINGDGVSELIFTAKDYVCIYDIFPPDNPQNKTGNDNILAKDSISGLRPPEGWDVRCSYVYRNFIVDLGNITQGYLSRINLNKDVNDYDVFDTDGDGKTDFIEKTSNTIGIISDYKKNENGVYQNTQYIGTSYNGEKEGLNYGDFNGDGKVDFIVPEKGVDNTTNWRIYTNTGNGFTEQYRSGLFAYKKDPDISDSGRKRHIYKFNFNKDINGDGKDDLIFVESQTFKKHDIGANRDSSFELKIKVNDGLDASGNIIFRDAYYDYIESTTDDLFIPINLSARIHNIDRFVMVKHGNTHFFAYDFLNIPNLYTINKIKQGGLTTEIIYNQLDAGNSNTSNFYQSSTVQQYPFAGLNNIPSKSIVIQLIQEGRKQDFKYRDLVVHLQGKGMIGFRKTARSSWYTDDLVATKIWSGAEIDPLNDGVPIKEWSIKTQDENQIFPTDISENNTQLLSFKSTEYRFDKLLNGSLVDFGTVLPPDKPRIVSATVPIKSISKDFMKDVRSESTITYDVDVAGSTKYYLPVKTVSNINTNFSVSTTNLSYLHNATGSGNAYFIGRPLNKTDEMKAYGDTKGAKEEYTYADNLLKTKKSYNRDNTGWFLETYSYDGFGNITQKVITSSIDSNSKIDVAEYDTKGRFVVKKTDNLGLITTITYNDWGQILTQTDPLGNVMTNEYDGWGKLLKSKSNLGGTTTYAYEKRANLDAVITQYSPDGNQKITYTNKLGQDYKTTTKKFGQNEFVSATVIFDALGRKINSSEPYSGEYPTKWNTVEYDDYSRPIKATSFTTKEVTTSYSGRTATVTETNANNRFKKQTADPIGNIISSEDMGGIIHLTFNAAGENTEANYEGNSVKTSYDAWGNKVRFEDPSNGVYEYEYNGYFGAISKTISPKGDKTYEYNSKGQLTKQKEKTRTGTGTDKVINFAYNDKGLITQKSGTSSGKSFNSGITYDSFGRVLSSYEDSNGKYFMKKGITYDEMMRVTSYEKSLYSSGILTKVALENVYDTWNGELSKVKEKGTGKILWELQHVNEKGQVTQAKLGSVNIQNTYATNGFLNNVNHTAGTTGNTILQIGYSFNAIKNELNTRTTGGDFNILEQFEYDDNNRLVNWTDPVTGTFTQNQKRNIYDNKGRITGNDQIGTIGFGNNLKKYQATSMTLNPQGTENYTNDLLQKITYNENNDPIFIDGVKGDVAFEYGLTSMRQKVTYGGNFAEDAQGKFTKFYSEDGSYEIIKNNQTGQEKHLIYIGGSPYESNIVYLKNYTESSGSFKFLHKDYLGSILAITDEAGTKLEQRHFDAWGNLTHLKIGTQATITDKNQIRDYLSAGNLVVDRGYTSHEHFAEVGLIHMNGRLYDPLLRRFLNADENIQDPHNTQNYNKYGYVLNNPLIYADPSGEFIWFVVGAVIGAYITGASANGTLNPFKWDWKNTWGQIALGAVFGAVSGGVGAMAGSSAAVFAASSLGIQGGVLGGAIAGLVGGAVGGAISGLGNAVIFGESVGRSIVRGFVSGAIGGAIIGGAVGGIQQGVVNAKPGAIKGNIWSGAKAAEGRSAWALKNTAKPTTVGKIAKVEAGMPTGEIIRSDYNPNKLNLENCLDCENPRFIFDSKGKGLDLDYFNHLIENPNNTIISGGKGGQNVLNLSGSPNSYTNLNNGHVVVFGSEGKPIFDVSALRIKGIFYNTTPSGKIIPSFGGSTKFDGSTPKSLLNLFGL